jgi:4a-hydroxytetrahydrobiopterin dehydratase
MNETRGLAALTASPGAFTGALFATRIRLRFRSTERREIDMTGKQPEKVYSDEEIQQRLTGALQHWYMEDGWLRRKYKTEGWKGTLMVVNTVGHLAEAAWHHPDLTVSYAFVVVKLSTHSAKGITDKDFALATKIEEVIQWQPGREGGALEGTPADDQRFRYIKYDAPKA